MFDLFPKKCKKIIIILLFLFVASFIFNGFQFYLRTNNSYEKIAHKRLSRDFDNVILDIFYYNQYLNNVLYQEVPFKLKDAKSNRIRSVELRARFGRLMDAGQLLTNREVFDQSERFAMFLGFLRHNFGYIQYELSNEGEITEETMEHLKYIKKTLSNLTEIILKYYSNAKRGVNTETFVNNHVSIKTLQQINEYFRNCQKLCINDFVPVES